MSSKVGWPATVRQMTYYFDVHDFLNISNETVGAGGGRGANTWSSSTYRDEQIRYFLLVTFSCLPILSSAS